MMTDTQKSDHMIALKRYDNAVESDRENIRSALEDLEFRAGKQWPDAARREREGENRPVLTINRTGQFVRQVTGDMRQTKPSIKVRGADDKADPDTAETLTGLIRNIENQSDARAAYHWGADSQVTCGIGHWRVNSRTVTDDVFEQDLVIEPIRNSVQVIWDPDSILSTREDAKFCFVPVTMTKEKFEAEYPNSDAIDFESEHFLDEQRHWGTADTVTVAEYWSKEPYKRKLAQLSDGGVVDVTDKSNEEIMALGALRVVEREAHKIVHRIMSGNEFLEPASEWPGKFIPIIPVLGEEIDTGKQTVRHGVVRYLKDPAQIYNYWRTAQTEQVALQPKAPFIVTDKEVEGLEQEWSNANVSNQPYIRFKPDNRMPAGSRPQRAVPPQPSAGMTEQIAMAAEDMKATTGIYDASLGNRSNETSGVAIRQRQQEGDVGTFVYMDNFARAVSFTGRVLIDLIPHFYDTQRVVRLLNEDGSEGYANLYEVVMTVDGPVVLNDLSAGRYDVVAEVGPSYSTKRQEAAEGMRELIQSAPNVLPIIGDLLIKSMDWPMADEISERFRKGLLPPGLAKSEEGEEPPPPDPAQEMEAAKVQLDAAETESKIEKTKAETEGQRLQNAEKQFQIETMAANIPDMVNQAVEARLAELLSQSQFSQ